MTSRFRIGIAILALLIIIAPQEAMADWTVRPFLGAAISPSHGFVDLEQTAGDTKALFGAAVEWRPRAIGFELDVSVLPGFFDGPGDLIVAGRVTTIMGNVTWQLPKPHESSRLRAYVSGGAGVVRVNLEDVLGAFSSSVALAGGNAGGGVLIRLRPRVDVNADVRYFKTRFGDVDGAGFGEQFVAFTRVTGGVALRF